MLKIDSKEFAERRKRLMADMEENSIAIIPSAKEVKRNNDVHYSFRQDSDFYYLTGFDEPDAVAVLVPGREHGEYILFCRDRDVKRELWDGYRAGPEGACSIYCADDAFPIGDMDDILPGIVEGKDCVYSAMGKHQEFDAQIMGWINVIRSNSRSGAQPPGEFVDLDHLLHDLRLYKSPAEVKVMAEAGKISCSAHKRVMQFCQPGKFEYQLEAEIMHEFAMAGSRQSAYPSIVGGGDNGCILHYIDNRDELNDGDLVLIDAGCEVDYYAADITRTFPVSGKFSEEQKAIYQVVLDSQLAAIDVIKPGNHWNDPHDATVRVIAQGLLDLGLLEGELDDLIKTEAYKTFYMHRAGHWLGMDVHDVGDYKVGNEWRVLEVGMALTVEPGIYIAKDDETVDEKWRGIGIRIEDDVVVVRGGCKVLTDGAPKTIDAIESLMAS